MTREEDSIIKQLEAIERWLLQAGDGGRLHERIHVDAAAESLSKARVALRHLSVANSFLSASNDRKQRAMDRSAERCARAEGITHSLQEALIHFEDTWPHVETPEDAFVLAEDLHRQVGPIVESWRFRP